MTQTLATDSAAASAPKSLAARILGIVFSPRATYDDVARHPRVLGAMIVVIAVIALATFAFLSTDTGRNASLDQQFAFMDSLGLRLNDTQIAQIEQRAESGRYYALASQVVFIPLATLIVAGLALAIFNAVLGGNASFKQVYAVVTHSWFLPMLQTLFVLPLNYARASMSSSTSLLVFLPMIDDATFVGRLLGNIDLFRMWWVFSLAVGLGVLYKRRTSPIAWSFIALYAVIALAIAGVATALSGA